MSRLTKKHEDNSGYHPIENHPVKKEITLFDFELDDYDCCVEKLGKIEDLMEKYKINSIEELENILIENSEELHVIQGIKYGIDGAISIVGKGMLYNKLSEELGCPLDVVFKALISGIIVENDEDFIEIGYSDREDKYVYFSTEEIYLKNWQSHGIEKTTNCFQITFGDDGEWCVYLNDYGKTWWLKGER